MSRADPLALLVHLGDRLGLYRAVAAAGTVMAEELVRETALYRPPTEPTL